MTLSRYFRSKAGWPVRRTPPTRSHHLSRHTVRRVTGERQGQQGQREAERLRLSYQVETGQCTQQPLQRLLMHARASAPFPEPSVGCSE